MRGSCLGNWLTVVKMPFSMSSARIAAFAASIFALRLAFIAFFPFLLLAACLAAQVVLVKPVLAFLLLPQFFLFLRGQGNRLQGGRDIPAHKVEVDFNLLRSVLAAFAGALMDKDFFLQTR